MGHKDHPSGDQSMVGAGAMEHSNAGALAEATTSPDNKPRPATPLQDSPSATPVATPESQDEGNVSIGKVSTISKEDGTDVDHPALSPPVPLPLSQETAAVPQITTLTEVQSL